MRVTLESIRACLEGAVPGVIATVAADGTPNVAYLSQVHYLDDAHVALSFQFFNKTRENVLANPRAVVQVIDPDTAAQYRLYVEYVRTETEGPLFENMKAKLAGIAARTGMGKVFRLLGADVYRLCSIEAVASESLPRAPARGTQLPALRVLLRRLSGCTDLAALLDETLDGLRSRFDIRHAMLLMYDRDTERLYTVGSRGYPASGVGSEVPLGDGVIGVAARECTPIRITHWTEDDTYSQAVRRSLDPRESGPDPELEIPFPGLTRPGSQMAVPILLGNGLLGVLYVESPEDKHFNYDDEDALVALCDHLGLAIRHVEQVVEHPDDWLGDQTPAAATGGSPVRIRHYAANNSVFIGEDYLIKGVAGAVFWKLVSDHVRLGRTDFTNRELRLDPSLRLPDICDNLEARLILLQRRLAERCDDIAIEKTGRGRFRLNVNRMLALEEMASPPR